MCHIGIMDVKNTEIIFSVLKFLVLRDRVIMITIKMVHVYFLNICGYFVSEIFDIWISGNTEKMLFL